MAKFIAWYNAVPKGSTRPRYETARKVQNPKVSCQYLVDYFNMIVIGTDQITYTEVNNFSKLMGIPLLPVESRLLVEMGRSYRYFLQKAYDPKCANPVATKEEKAQQKMLGIKAYMRSLQAERERKKNQEERKQRRMERKRNKKK